MYLGIFEAEVKTMIGHYSAYQQGKKTRMQTNPTTYDKNSTVKR